MVYYPKEIEYSDKYYDNIYEYKHVILTKDLSKKIPKDRLLTEDEWRNLGIQQTKGWVHYCAYPKETHVLLFRRPKGTDPESGQCSKEIKENVYKYEQFKEDLFLSK